MVSFWRRRVEKTCMILLCKVVGKSMIPKGKGSQAIKDGMNF